MGLPCKLQYMLGFALEYNQPRMRATQVTKPLKLVLRPYRFLPTSLITLSSRPSRKHRAQQPANFAAADFACPLELGLCGGVPPPPLPPGSTPPPPTGPPPPPPPGSIQWTPTSTHL